LSENERIERLVAEPSWSLYSLDQVSPLTILAVFYGHRTGQRPLRDPAYVVFTEVELVDTGGTLDATHRLTSHGRGRLRCSS